MPRRIEISHRTIIFTVLLLAALWFLYFIKDVILQVFVALLIALILSPLVSKLSKLRIPRILSVIVVYLIFLSIFIGVVAGLVPPMIEQTTSFANSLPKYLNNIELPFGLSDELVREISGHLASLPEQIIRLIVSTFSNILTIFTVIIISFYMLAGWDKLNDQLEDFFGERIGGQTKDFIQRLEVKLGSWARGQLLLMLLVGLCTYVGLLIIGIPYALALSILAAILEIVPMLGPVLAAIPAVIVGFSINPVMGMLAAALAFLIQQLENYVFVPNVMKKSVGLSPVITLVALIIGFKLAGVAGAILSVPVVITLQTILGSRFFNEK